MKRKKGIDVCLIKQGKFRERQIERERERKKDSLKVRRRERNRWKDYCFCLVFCFTKRERTKLFVAKGAMILFCCTVLSLFSQQ